MMFDVYSYDNSGRQRVNAALTLLEISALRTTKSLATTSRCRHPRCLDCYLVFSRPY